MLILKYKPPHQNSQNEPGGGLKLIILPLLQVNPRSLAEKFHLRPGDGVMRIGQVPALYLNHDQAKAEILRAGNELELMLRRLS